VSSRSVTVRAIASFLAAIQAFEYLAPYILRLAISNIRIVKLEDGKVPAVATVDLLSPRATKTLNTLGSPRESNLERC
jgi:Putative transposase